MPSTTTKAKSREAQRRKDEKKLRRVYVYRFRKGATFTPEDAASLPAQFKIGLLAPVIRCDNLTELSHECIAALGAAFRGTATELWLINVPDEAHVRQGIERLGYEGFIRLATIEEPEGDDDD